MMQWRMANKGVGMAGRAIFGASLGIVLAFGMAGNALAEARSFAAKDYAAMLAKAKAGDPAADFTFLRQQEAIRDHYLGSHWQDAKRADELLATKPEETLSLARQASDQSYTTMIPHVLAEMALEKLGRHDEAQREHATVIAILRSIMTGHHGANAEDAFNAVSVGEEYDTLAILGLRPAGQSLINQNGHSFDLMKSTHDGQPRDVWFNIDYYFGHELDG